VNPDGEVLVSVAYGGTTAGVIRGEDMCWLCGDLATGGGIGLDDHRPVLAGVEGDRAVEGGLLPPGAVAAEVVDRGGDVAAAAANGAWVIVLGEPVTGAPYPVRYLDGAGRTVRPPLPEAWPRIPVTDTTERCPACGFGEWDEITPLDHSRGSSGAGEDSMAPTPTVVCRRCGHEEREGTFYAATSGPATSAPPAAEALRARRALVRDHVRMALSDVGFPVFAAAGRPCSYGGSSTGDAVTDSVTIDHGAELSVCTSAEGRVWTGVRELAREALEQRLPDEGSGPWAEASHAALTLWCAASERRRRQRAAAAEARVQPFRVDGAVHVFELVGNGERWAAAGWLGELIVTITAEGVAPEAVELERLADPLAAVLGDS
jgi:ribosomal protein L37E